MINAREIPNVLDTIRAQEWADAITNLLAMATDHRLFKANEKAQYALYDLASEFRARNHLID